MEPVRDYELKAFFSHVIEVLERLDIAYMVLGGFAAIFHGKPRLTVDIDIVADMKPAHVGPFMASFPIPDYYASEEGMHDSLRRRYPFNVIQSTTGAKVDLVLLPTDPFTRAAFQRLQDLFDYIERMQKSRPQVPGASSPDYRKAKKMLGLE